jgi:pseudoazurin
MTTTLNRRTFVIATATLAGTTLAVPGRGAAESTHQVEMLNAAPDNPRLRNVFAPRILSVQPGDTVSFVPTDRSHNSASIDGMIPEAAEPWDGRINQSIDVTLTVPGIYGYKCTPHLALGMAGLIIVEGEGKLDNLEAAKAVRQRGRATQVWEEIWAEAEAAGLLS